MNNSSRENKPLAVSTSWHYHNRRVGFDREQTISTAIYSVTTMDLARHVLRDNRILGSLIGLWLLSSANDLRWLWTRFVPSASSADSSMATKNRTRSHVHGSCSAFGENDDDDSMGSSWTGLVLMYQTKEYKTTIDVEKIRPWILFNHSLSETDGFAAHRKEVSGFGDRLLGGTTFSVDHFFPLLITHLLWRKCQQVKRKTPDREVSDRATHIYFRTRHLSWQMRKENLIRIIQLLESLNNNWLHRFVWLAELQVASSLYWNTPDKHRKKDRERWLYTYITSINWLKARIRSTSKRKDIPTSSDSQKCLTVCVSMSEMKLVDSIFTPFSSPRARQLKSRVTIITSSAPTVLDALRIWKTESL